MHHLIVDPEVTRYLMENRERLLTELGPRGRARYASTPTLEKASGPTYGRSGFKQVNLGICGISGHDFRRVVAKRGVHLGEALDEALWHWANRPAGVWPGDILRALEDHPLSRLPDTVGAKIHPAALRPFLDRVKLEGGKLKDAARAAIVLWSGLPRAEGGAGWKEERLSWDARMKNDWSWQPPLVPAPGAASPAPASVIPPACTSGENPASQAPPVDLL